MEILFAWIGTADYNASQSDSLDRPGPVLQALNSEKFDKVILIQNVVSKKKRVWVKRQMNFLTG